MKQPLVSVVVNNYNNERYLSECLDALLRQSYDNLEIVVVDAFSSDASRALLERYAASDDRIKLIYSDAYIKYPAISYNLAFLSCSGNFIAINDPDDVSLPTRIEQQVAFLIANEDVDVVGCSVIRFNDAVEDVVFLSVETNVNNADPPAWNPTLMFRKKTLAEHGLWKWQCEYAADFEWLYRWYANGACFFVMHEPLIRYRYSHGGNISNMRAINQAVKLAVFRTYFGLRLLRVTGLRWWYKTALTYYYACSLSVKWSVAKLGAIVR